MVTKWPPNVWMGVVDPCGKPTSHVKMDNNEYIGPGPGEWKELNPSPKELFDLDESE